MKRSQVILWLCVILLLAASPASLLANGAIMGEIHYSGLATGPVVIATINLQLDFEKLFSLDTLETGPGPFELTDVTPGTYLIAAFLDVNGDGLPALSEPMGAYNGSLEVKEGETVEDVQIYIKPLPRGSASITGTISYSGSLSGKINLFVVGATSTPFNQIKVDAPGGSFTASGLAAGDYILAAYLDVNENKQPDLGEPIGFYPEKISVEDEQEVTIDEIQLYDAANFSGSISGEITYTPIDNDTIFIYTVGLSTTPVTVTKVISPQTTFTADNLADGDYYMFAFLDSSHDRSFTPMEINLDELGIVEGEPYEFIATPIKIEAGQSATQNLTLAPTGDSGISGKMTYAGKQTGLPIVVAVGLSPSWFGLAPAFSQPYTIPNLDAGYYAVIGGILPFSADAKISADMPLGFYTKEFVHVTEHDTVTGIDFILQDSTTATSSITGTVNVPDGVSGDVHVFSLGISLSPYKSVTLTDDMNFTISNLRMGRYLTAAFMDVNGNGAFDFDEPVGFTDSLVEIPSGNLIVNVDLNLEEFPITELTPENSAMRPDQFVLGQNYPNPFNPETAIRYQVPQQAPVTIKVYDMLGQEVCTLVNAVQPAGQHQVVWNGKDTAGNNVASGIYLYCLKAGTHLEFKRMVLVR
ncbi:T9SS type A sorting domain-containing protein [candidate division KSB1 bacterium]|nr:T9SS type A sorting domain-containing protein [candidate division KSB1 bacterium]